MIKKFKTTDGQVFDTPEEAVEIAKKLCSGNPEVEEIEVDEEGNEAAKPEGKGKGKGKAKAE